jgi:hypothetical protein
VRGIDSEYQWPSVWALHYGLFPIVGLAMLAAVVASEHKQLSFRAFLTLIPVPAWIVLAVVLVYVLATFLIFTPLTGAGDPVIVDWRLFFNDHGVMREVSEAQFHIQRSISLAFIPASGSISISFRPSIFLTARGGAHAAPAEKR